MLVVLVDCGRLRVDVGVDFGVWEKRWAGFGVVVVVNLEGLLVGLLLVVEISLLLIRLLLTVSAPGDLNGDRKGLHNVREAVSIRRRFAAGVDMILYLKLIGLTFGTPHSTMYPDHDTISHDALKDGYGVPVGKTTAVCFVNLRHFLNK